MRVEKDGIVYDWCTGEQNCPEVYYRGSETGEKTCVSVQVCENLFKAHAYVYGDERECIGAAPADENEFLKENYVYSCKEGTYIAFTEDGARCFAKKDCPGFVIYDAECWLTKQCPMYLHEDKTGRECIDELACISIGLVTFV